MLVEGLLWWILFGKIHLGRRWSARFGEKNGNGGQKFLHSGRLSDKAANGPGQTA